jgi:hypothetical protein
MLDGANISGDLMMEKLLGELRRNGRNAAEEFRMILLAESGA